MEYSRENLIEELKRYDDLIHDTYMQKLKRTSTVRWQLHYNSFMGHKFRLMNIIKEMDSNPRRCPECKRWIVNGKHESI